MFFFGISNNYRYDDYYNFLFSISRYKRAYVEITYVIQFFDSGSKKLVKALKCRISTAVKPYDSFLSDYIYLLFYPYLWYHSGFH